jgi:hypothetical protein
MKFAQYLHTPDATGGHITSLTAEFWRMQSRTEQSAQSVTLSDTVFGPRSPSLGNCPERKKRGPVMDAAQQQTQALTNPVNLVR